ncbi:MAG: TPM domain-containing protein [Bacteroidales bacterium]|nr:TPM domain-containing protein [Bacteroidales bacterium]
MLKKRFCLVLAIILIGVTGFAQKIPARPVPPRLVNDFANILSDKEEYALETKLVNYNDTTSTQICVVTVTSLDGTTSDDFAQKLGEKWGVGTKDNNGVVILVKPKTADELGDVSIQVGYGMEPYITDAVNYVIRTKEMIPAFKEGDYYTGIDNAVDAIIGLASGAFTAEEYADEDGDALGILVIFLAIMVVIVLISSSGKGKGGRRSSGFWNGFFLGSMFSGGGGSSWGSGGGSWGGGHGGGFGGFGGGHFGGGGGSSKW